MKPVPTKSWCSAGFSLLELLIVSFMILIMSCYLYGYASGKREKTQKAVCRDQLQKIYIALQIYANDYSGSLPVNTNARTSEEALAALVPKDTIDTSIFICPGRPLPSLPAGESFRTRKISYAYYMGARLDPPGTALVSDQQINTDRKQVNDEVFSVSGNAPGNNHKKNGGNFLLADGSAQSTGPHLEFPLVVAPGTTLLNPKP